MMLRTAIALIALAVPGFAQHSDHAGSSGGRGSASHAGISGSSGLSRSFASPSRATTNGGSSRAGVHGASPPNFSNFRIPYNSNPRAPYNGSGFAAGRAPNNRASAGMSGDENRGGGDRRRRHVNNWYSSGYSIWPAYGYPYVIDPGFYDWSDTDSGDSQQASANDQNGSGYDQGDAAPAYPTPYPEEGSRPPYQGPAAPAPIAASAASLNHPLTVIFRDGRAPIKIQNYIMTAKVLTDLDSEHHEQILLDEIDVTATEWANHAVGVKFQVPSATLD